MDKQPSAVEELRQRVVALEEHVANALSYFCRGSVKGLRAGKSKSATRAFTQVPFRGPASIVVAISPTMDNALTAGSVEIMLTAGKQTQTVTILPEHDTGAFLMLDGALSLAAGEPFSISLRGSDYMEPNKNDFDVLVWRRRGTTL